MWVASSYGGIDAVELITHNIIFSIKTDHFGAQLKDQWIKSITIQNNILWFSTATGISGLNLISGKRAVPKIYTNVKNNNKSILTISKILNIDSTKLWLLCDELGIVELNTSTLNGSLIFAGNEFLRSHDKKDIKFWGAVKDNNTIYLATNAGLKILECRADKYKLADKLKTRWLSENPITSCELGEGQFLFLGCNKGLFALNKLNGIVDTISYTTEGSLYGFISTLKKGSGHNIWVGSQNGLGQIIENHTPIKSFLSSQLPYTKKHHLYTIHPLTQRKFLVGAEDGLYITTDGTDVPRKIHDGNQVSLIFPLFNSSCLISYDGGLLLFKNFKIFDAITLYPELSEIKGDILTSGIRFNDSIYLFGSALQRGVYIWNTRRREVSRLKDFGIDNTIVKALYSPGNEKTVLILSETAIGLYRPLEGSFTVKHILNGPDRISQGVFMDICRTKDQYWIAAYGSGLIMTDLNFNFQRLFSTKDKLSNLGVYKLLPIGDSLLFITSNNGLFKFNTNSLTFKQYTQEEGLHSNTFEEGCGIVSSSIIYAGGYNGFSIIDPSKLIPNLVPPRVYINRVVIGRRANEENTDRTGIHLRKLTIPNDVIQTKLYFSGINYSSPGRTTFQYRIKESEAWTNNGTDNAVSLIGLKPGTYHFEVKAANEDGVWSEPATITLIYLPKWYQTWWFKVLLGLAVAGAAYSFYRMRINQILKQQKIRKDVASDLHDDIGSSLNSIKVFAHLAGADPSKKEYIQNVETNLEHATVGLRDMIWILDDKLDSVTDLCSRLEQLAARPAEAVGITVHFKIQEGLGNRILPKHIKRNLFLIVKEAINNSIKYAQCRNIDVQFALRQKKLQLQIRDDGIGFDLENKSAGYGLGNMKNRAEQIHFDCVIHSGSTGTSITLVEK